MGYFESRATSHEPRECANMSAFDPIWSGVRRTAPAVESGEISAVEVAEAHVARMEALEPGLNAFITRNAKAVTDAGKVPRGPLAGVPISIKDLVLTRGMPTTAGSRTFGKGLPGKSDAPVARRLRRAGARRGRRRRPTRATARWRTTCRTARRSAS